MGEPHMIREIRVPVPLPPPDMTAPAEMVPPLRPHGAEYFVVEIWSDFTVRHPTTGVQVTRELWDTDRKAACRILRTEGI